MSRNFRFLFVPVANVSVTKRIYIKEPDGSEAVGSQSISLFNFARRNAEYSLDISAMMAE